ncbi:MAG: YHS domain-containing protein [Betaproteobacteria bacterium]|nr:YHS domain-containing protein [Betaproteobacteria bacterium]
MPTTLGKHTLGKADVKTDHDGATYRFMSEENKAMFLKEPAKYVPQYGGYCSNGIVYGIPWGGDPETWKIIGGKRYIFGGTSSKNYFLMDEKANSRWRTVIGRMKLKGHNAFIQRYKRPALRVPHYKTGKELEAQWQKQQAAK